MSFHPLYEGKALVIQSTMAGPEMIILSLVFVGLLAWIFLSNKKNKKLNLPPGPRGWPVVGSMFLLKKPLHLHFTALNKQYGPVVMLTMGQRTIVVVSNNKLAMEVLKTRDAEFASRPDTAMLRQASLHHTTIGLSRYSDNVKRLRKLAISNLLSPTKLSSSAHLRAERMKSLVKSVMVEGDRAFDLTRVLFKAASDSLVQMLFGRQFRQDPVVMRRLADHFLEEGLAMSVGDVIPWLRWVDKVLDRESVFRDSLIPQLKRFFARVIEDHERYDAGREDSKDFMDVLLDLKKEHAVEEAHITGVLVSLILAGFSTSEATLDYALAEVIRHPRVMLKAQEEIDQVVSSNGNSNRWVQESDLPNLPYILAIVKETLRLHNPAPLGLPHCNPAASKIGGYDIPPNSTVFVNHFAIGRAASAWKDPDVFCPERFLDSSFVAAVAESFDYNPFGEGRRKCLGYNQAMKFVPLTVATLLQGFDLEAVGEVDMSETDGGGIRRKNELIVLARQRLQDNMYSSEM